MFLDELGTELLQLDLLLWNHRLLVVCKQSEGRVDTVRKMVLQVVHEEAPEPAHHTQDMSRADADAAVDHDWGLLPAECLWE